MPHSKQDIKNVLIAQLIYGLPANFTTALHYTMVKSILDEFQNVDIGLQRKVVQQLNYRKLLHGKAILHYSGVVDRTNKYFMGPRKEL